MLRGGKTLQHIKIRMKMCRKHRPEKKAKIKRNWSGKNLRERERERERVGKND